MTDTVSQILTERKTTHGDYRDHAYVTQGIEQILRFNGPNYKNLDVCQLESLHMIAHKMGRIVCGNANVKDHWDDIAGYAKLISDQLENGKEA